jgi:hypothetical protein
MGASTKRSLRGKKKLMPRGYSVKLATFLKEKKRRKRCIKGKKKF